MRTDSERLDWLLRKTTEEAACLDDSPMGWRMAIVAAGVGRLPNLGCFDTGRQAIDAAMDAEEKGDG